MLTYEHLELCLREHREGLQREADQARLVAQALEKPLEKLRAPTAWLRGLEEIRT